MSVAVSGGSGDANTGASVVDRLIDASGKTIGYVTSIGTGAGTGADDDVISWASTPYGSAGTGSATGAFAATNGYEVVAASAFAGFSNNTGGIIDTSSATDVDITVGNGASIDVDATTVANADADNVDGDAYATANVLETMGLDQTGVVAGGSGTLTGGCGCGCHRRCPDRW